MSTARLLLLVALIAFTAAAPSREKRQADPTGGLVSLLLSPLTIIMQLFSSLFGGLTGSLGSLPVVGSMMSPITSMVPNPASLVGQVTGAANGLISPFTGVLGGLPLVGGMIGGLSGPKVPVEPGLPVIATTPAAASG